MRWGDVATWVAVFFAAVGGTVALIQLRQQGNVLKGEVERNKRRDQLLDGQLLDLKERLEDRAREQAEMVRVSMPETRGWIQVENRSSRPITRIDAQIQEALPDGGQAGHGASQWMYHSDRSDGLDRHLRGIFPVLMSQAEAQAQFWHPPEAESVRGVVRFNDDVGRRWQLDNLMHLERAPDDNW